jgi:hypothetical protein
MKALIIAGAKTLQEAPAQALTQALDAHDVDCVSLAEVHKHPELAFDFLVFILTDKRPPRPMVQWVELVGSGKLTGRVIVLQNGSITPEWEKSLKPELSIDVGDDVADRLAFLFGDSAGDAGSIGEPVSDDLTSDEPASALESGISMTSDVDLKIDEAQADPFAEGDQDLLLASAGDNPESLNDSFLMGDDNGPAAGAGLDAFSAAESSMDLSGTEVGASLDLGSDDAGSNDLLAGSFGSEDSEENKTRLSVAMQPDDGPDLLADPKPKPKPAPEPARIKHPDANIRAPLAGRDTFNAVLEVPGVSNASPFGELGDLGDSSPEAPRRAGKEDFGTLQRYAALKEREAREKEATIQVLRGQIEKMRAQMARSEAERRRITLGFQESDSLRKTLEEELHQTKFHVQKLEQTHQEEMRALQLRLDNALFTAAKTQNKLDDFRERVRVDILKIRGTERELSNKLELQKRDAEALLSSKDEQLLQQKREIDRLSYELDNLKERFVEETERAEDRQGKLNRAIQSLRLAEDMLSGMNEEVLPAAADKKEDAA